MTHVAQGAHSTVLTPETDIVASNAQELRTTLCECIAGGQYHIVIDLQHVAMVDSSGLGVFIATHNSVKAQGGAFRVVNVSPDILRLLQVMRLDQHFAVEGR
jgi:anti-sigma B factor antagonist